MACESTVNLCRWVQDPTAVLRNASTYDASPTFLVESAVVWCEDMALTEVDVRLVDMWLDLVFALGELRATNLRGHWDAGRNFRHSDWMREVRRLRGLQRKDDYDPDNARGVFAFRLLTAIRLLFGRASDGIRRVKPSDSRRWRKVVELLTEIVKRHSGAVEASMKLEEAAADGKFANRLDRLVTAS